MKAFCEGLEKFADFVDVQIATAGVESLDESAHMSALKLLWEVYGEGDRGDSVLFGVCLVPDSHWETEVFDTDAVDGDLTVIGLVLGVFEVSERGR